MKGGQKIDKLGVLFKGNASPTAPGIFKSELIENRRCCRAHVLGLNRKKFALKGGQDLEWVFK
jgi:hypothetical protein